MAVNLPFSYKSYRKTSLHRANAGVKLITLFVFCALALVRSIYTTAALSGLLIIASCFAKISPRQLFCGIVPLLIMLAAAAVYRAVGFVPLSFNTNELIQGVLFAYRVMLSFCAAQIFFSVTTITEVKNSLGRLGKRFSLSVSLMLMFIPRFFRIWDAMLCAYRARAGKKGSREIFILLPLVLERLLQCASDTATALTARGTEL
ncbi:hypothetical protein FACS189494_11710 [Spirochaetia bacterium]|nr:hypothetical protein FACS189494_11710 [Spirochaetia bacterium]